MRFAITLAAAAFLVAPAFAQRVVPAPTAPADQSPPPEGFYKDIPNMYDLLARPMAMDNMMLVNGQRTMPECPRASALTDEHKAMRRAHLANGIQSLYETPTRDLRLCLVPKGDRR